MRRSGKKEGRAVATRRVQHAMSPGASSRACCNGALLNKREPKMREKRRFARQAAQCACAYGKSAEGAPGYFASISVLRGYRRAVDDNGLFHGGMRRYHATMPASHGRSYSAAARCVWSRVRQQRRSAKIPYRVRQTSHFVRHKMPFQEMEGMRDR